MRQKGLLALAVILCVTGNLSSLMIPKFSGYAIDCMRLGAGSVDMDGVVKYALLMLIMTVVSSLLSYFLACIMIVIARRLTYSLRKEVFAKIMNLPVAYFDAHQTGDILSRITYDVDVINGFISGDLASVLSSAITVVGSLVMMLTIKPALVLVFVVSVPISIFATRRRIRKTGPLFKRRSESAGALNSFVEERTSGQKSFRAYCAENELNEDFSAVNRDTVNAYYEAERESAKNGPSVNFVNNLSLAFVSMFGALLYINGLMGIGDISGFVLYSRKFSGPINEIANVIGDIQSFRAASNRLYEVMNMQEVPSVCEKSGINFSARGDVEFKDVYFSYVAGKPIISGLNLTVKRGERIAIVGPTGAGKTTIINLLMRYYDATGGDITINGTSIYSLDYGRLRKSFALVLQDPWLFGGTVYDNIAYGKPEASNYEVEAAAETARVLSYIKTLPNGLNSEVTENGGNISKGQKQLLTIARSILTDFDILLLDEATSNVDALTEKQMQEAMENIMRGKTCFIVAHRLSTIKTADKILYVENGKICEMGKHEELLAKNGKYSALYNAQFIKV